MRVWLLVFSVLALPVLQAQDDCQSKPNLDSWLDCRVSALVVAKMNQRGNTQQAESPALAGSSTSLVDQSSAPDLGAIALNLLSPASQEGDPKSASGTVTSSAYALYAAIADRDPLDPSFYNKGINWRRVSITFGREFPDDDASGSSQRATILGGKVLLLNYRDASHRSNQADIKAVSEKLRDSSPNYARITRQVQDFIYEVLGGALGTPAQIDKQLESNFKATIALLNEQQLSHIDEIVGARLEPEIRLHAKVIEVLTKIQRAPQLALAFTTKQRSEMAADEYRTELTFDWGIADRFNWTLNASSDYSNSQEVGKDQKGGRLASQFAYRLTRAQLTGRNPVSIAVATEGKWMTETTPTYTAQFKLTLPIAAGIDFPISVSWANRTALVKENSVKGRFGFTFDFAKLASALK